MQLTNLNIDLIKYLLIMFLGLNLCQPRERLVLTSPDRFLLSCLQASVFGVNMFRPRSSIRYFPTRHCPALMYLPIKIIYMSAFFQEELANKNHRARMSGLRRGSPADKGFPSPVLVLVEVTPSVGRKCAMCCSVSVAALVPAPSQLGPSSQFH